MKMLGVYVALASWFAVAADSSRVDLFADSSLAQWDEENPALEEGRPSPPVETLKAPVLVQEPARQANAPERPPGRLSVLYLGGGDGAAWFHLGVLDAVERFRIPIDTVVGASWGAWVGALWSAGWSTGEIAALLQEEEIASVMPQVKLDETSPLLKDALWDNIHLREDAGSAGWRATWKLEEGQEGLATLTPWFAASTRMRQQEAWFRLRVEESLRREPPGRLIPFRAVLCKEESRMRSWSASERTLASLPLSGGRHSGELCAAYGSPAGGDSTLNLVVFPMPVRDEGKTLSIWQAQVYASQQEAWSLNAAKWVTVRPHRLGSLISPSAMRQAGFDAFKAKLGELSPLASRLRYYHHRSGMIVSRFAFTPVFDSVASVYQGHMSSYWPSDTGLAAPRRFFNDLADAGFYDSLSLGMGNNGDLRVRASGAPQLSLDAGAFGGPWHGIQGLLAADLLWVDQFEYDARLEGFYGQGMRGVRPRLRLGRLWGARGDFFVEGEMSSQEPLVSALANEPYYTRLLRENRRDLSVGVDYRLQEQTALRAFVYMGNAQLWTQMRSLLNATEYAGNELDPLEVASLELDGVLTDSTRGYERWFGTHGRHLRLQAGFHSVGVHVFGQNSAPLYLSTQGEWQGAWPVREHLSLGWAMAGGLDMRRGAGGRVLYPDQLEIVPDQVSDPALDNRYRLRMEVSPWRLSWPGAEISSHHYALARTGLVIHSQGSGLYLYGGYARDFEGNPWTSLSADRLFFEPVLRLRHASLDCRLGMGRLVSMDQYEKLGDWDGYRYYAQLGAFAF